MEINQKLYIINNVLKKDDKIFFKNKYKEEDIILLKRNETNNLSVSNSLRLEQVINYFYDLYRGAIENVFSENEIIKKEMKYIMDTQHCVYMSVILKKIIKYLIKEEVEFNIGFCEYEDENPISKMFFGITESLCVHSWISIEGTIIDVTLLPQVKTFVSIDNLSDFIIGSYPKKLTMSVLNPNRNKELEEKCFANLLKHLNISEDEWIEAHLIELDKYKKIKKLK